MQLRDMGKRLALMNAIEEAHRDGLSYENAAAKLGMNRRRL